MFSSLQTRIISVVAGIVLVTTLTLLLTGQWQTRKFLLKEEDEKAQSLLKAMVFAVNIEYQSMQFFREQHLQHTKGVAKDMVDAAMAIIQTEYERVKNDGLTSETVQRYCIEELRNMRYNDGNGYFWINEDRSPYPVMIMHPLQPKLESRNLYDPIFNCVAGSGENLFKTLQRLCVEKGGGFVEYEWPRDIVPGAPKARKMSYCREFKPWKWIVGSGFWMSEVDREVRQREEAIIRELQHTVTNFRVGSNGYYFIFSGKKRLLVHPSEGIDGAEKAMNPDTGRLLFDEIVLDCRSGRKYSDYRWTKLHGDRNDLAWKRVYCEYYAPLDWYICVSYYLEDVEGPVRAFWTRMLLMSAALMLVALAVSIVLACSLTYPLRRLAVAAETIDREGIDEMAIPITGSAETRELGMVLDRALTTIRNKENSLKASEENLRITLSSIGDAVVVTDIDGRITRMNAVAEKLLGWTFAEAKGRSLLDGVKFISVQNGEPVDNPINMVLLDGETHRMEGTTIMICRDGERRLIDDSSAPIRSRDGQMVGVVMAFRDVTEQARMTEVLHQSQKMDSLGQLAGGVAHDFNNMLGGIMACADLLRRKFASENEKIKEYSELIVSTCERAGELTSKLLAFSRKGKVLSTPIDLHMVIRDACVIMERSLDKRILLISHLDAPVATVIGDPAQIQNIIINLGINSGLAMPEGGTITITTRDIELDDSSNLRRELELNAGPYVEISFADTGCGIPPEIIGRIFEPFFTTREAGKGTGLGLAAVYGSVKEHHGAIRVTSTVGSGTVFWIYLPVHAEIKLQHNLNMDSMPMGHGCILLVDDEKIIRTASKGLLEDLGYEVLVAEDGAQGLEVYRANMDKINVVILDMVMPKMNGADCFYQIRKLNPTAKVLMASGFSGNAVVATLKRDGLLGFLNKPYRSIDIARILKEVIDL